MWRTQDELLINRESTFDNLLGRVCLRRYTRALICSYFIITLYKVYVRSAISMEDVLKSLRAGVEDKEFLRLTRTALKLVQNVLNDPGHEKYRRIRASSKVRWYRSL